MKTIALTNQNNKNLDIYQMKDFNPSIIDEDYLKKLNVNVKPSNETIAKLVKGSQLFIKRLENRTVIPTPILELTEIDIESNLEIHNYTGACPTLTYEISPIIGCNVGCLYCLVTDGEHVNHLRGYTNYHLLIRRVLEEKYNETHYYYFSPKTECFQEPTLETGIAHNILKEFIKHFEKHPHSKARLFIASKAGIKQLLYKYEDETIIDLLTQLKGRVQFNTSVSIMPKVLQNILEPNAASIDERLQAVSLCQSQGIMADSALVQPIVAPFLTSEVMEEFFKKLNEVHIINYKPEFLTLCMENLAMIGQIQGYYNKGLEKELYEYYIEPENESHRKQRGRTAPSKDLSKHYLNQLIKESDKYGISSSICFWVRKQLNISEEMIPIINRNGFQCLGYQTKLFNE